MHPIIKLKYFSSCVAVVFAQSIDTRYWVENEDVVGAALTGDAATTSEGSTILLVAKVRLKLEVWQYIYHTYERNLFHVDKRWNNEQLHHMKSPTVNNLDPKLKET